MDFPRALRCGEQSERSPCQLEYNPPASKPQGVCRIRLRLSTPCVAIRCCRLDLHKARGAAKAHHGVRKRQIVASLFAPKTVLDFARAMMGAAEVLIARSARPP